MFQLRSGCLRFAKDKAGEIWVRKKPEVSSALEIKRATEDSKASSTRPRARRGLYLWLHSPARRPAASVE